MSKYRLASAKDLHPWYYLGLPVPIQFVGTHLVGRIDFEVDRRFTQVMRADGIKALIYYSPEGFKEIKIEGDDI